MTSSPSEAIVIYPNAAVEGGIDYWSKVKADAALTKIESGKTGKLYGKYRRSTDTEPVKEMPILNGWRFRLAKE